MKIRQDKDEEIIIYHELFEGLRDRSLGAQEALTFLSKIAQDIEEESGVNRLFEH